MALSTNRSSPSLAGRTRSRAVRAFVVAAAGSLLLVGPIGLRAYAAATGDWSQYQGNAAHIGQGNPGPNPPLVIQQTTTFPELPGGPTRSYGLSAPVVSSGTAVMVGPTKVYAVAVGSGGVTWSIDRDYGPSVPAAVTAGTLLPPGQEGTSIFASVIFTEGFGAGPGAPPATPTPSAASPSSSASPSGSPSPTMPGATESHVDAVSLATGRSLWKAPVALKAVSRTGVTLDAGSAFVGDIRGNIYALDPANGKILWTTNVGGFLENPLAAGDGTVFVSVQGTNTAPGKVVALSETTGKPVWSYSTSNPPQALMSGPALAGGRVFVAASAQSITGPLASLQELDAAKGSLLWTAPLLAAVSPFTSPVVSGDQAFVQDTGGQVYGINAGSGQRDWLFALNSQMVWGAPVVSGGRVLVPSATGRLVVLDPGTGEKVWTTANASGQLRYGAVLPDAVVFTRGGSAPGLVTFRSDPSAGALTSIASPTTPDYGAMVLFYLAAGAALTLILLVIFRPIAARLGPAFLVDDPDDDLVDPFEESMRKREDDGGKR